MREMHCGRGISVELGLRASLQRSTRSGTIITTCEGAYLAALVSILALIASAGARIVIARQRHICTLQ